MTDQRAAFLDPGTYAAYRGQLAPETVRLRQLTWLFAGQLMRGSATWVMATGFLLPALGILIYAMVRTQFETFAVPLAERGDFVLDAMGWLWTTNVAALVLAAASRVAPVVARDAAEGALLLYFARPIRREHYLYARWLAVAGVGFVLLAGPATLQLFGLAAVMDTPGAPLGLWFLPVVLVANWLAAAAVVAVLGLVGLACGVVLRSPGNAPLLLGGGIFASVIGARILAALSGDDSLWLALDLLRGLRAFLHLPMLWLHAAPAGHTETLQDVLGLLLWLGLAAGAWTTLQRWLLEPPLGKGRAG